MSQQTERKTRNCTVNSRHRPAQYFGLAQLRWFSAPGFRGFARFQQPVHLTLPKGRVSGFGAVSKLKWVQPAVTAAQVTRIGWPRVKLQSAGRAKEQRHVVWFQSWCGRVSSGVSLFKICGIFKSMNFQSRQISISKKIIPAWFGGLGVSSLEFRV